MEVETIALQKRTSFSLYNETGFCKTMRYHWKFRDIHAVAAEQFDDYLAQKKLKLLDGKSNDTNSSLLALLPEPSLLKHTDKAAQRLLQAIQNKEKITIFGDYDVDGTTSCAMLFLFFEEIGYPVDIYIPDRILEGYGFNKIGLQKIAQQGTQVVVTVDNGISAVEACEAALSLGIDVIITDHHDIPPTLPRAFAILNPKQNDCPFPYKMLAGVGVAFYLLIALRSLLRSAGHNVNVNLKNLLDFVAIGTIADMAPLTGINHIFCKIGLDVLCCHLTSGNRVGIYQLLKLAGWKEGTPVDAGDVGFKIGPRLNAAGRLGNALRSVELLCEKNNDLAISKATFLHHENSERQLLEKKYTQQAFEKVSAFDPLPEALVLFDESWHPGVVGLVASRVLEKYYRPVLVFGMIDGKLKGSGRSTHAFNLFSVLNQVRDELVSFGGHYHAVGLTIMPEKLSWLTSYLAEQARQLISESQKLPPLYIDGNVPIHFLNPNFLKKLEDLEPYGIENPRTRWLVGPVSVGHVKRIGKDLSQSHAKVMFIENGKDFWMTAFGLAHVFEEHLATGVELLLVVEAKKSFWNGRDTVDIRVIDYAPVF
ncbi:MAG: single-stranded-DNA-specific exonuclease RecJ [Spirobacillus cienkowskii]|uniref:Single-stranded-DNA-specific exonuclease RecJ n=1 Tax=Spirobacillus cienkowskii TaxID=495820 RepID=A0A369KLP4_9BACT|nr:MAG: single-stranded-DNA-specific exonuclease RecJ [Spirobacillus cienkowskii]